MSLKCRHVRPVLRRTTNMSPSLPVMPPFRQRLFPRQHASEYQEASISSALSHKMAARTPQTWSQFGGEAENREEDNCHGLASVVLAKDLLHPSPEEEKRRHKKKRLVQSPNSYFMDVKCPGCYKITTVFSHAQTVVLCVGCSTVLCQPTGGKARLTEGCSFRRKQH
ncbi:hypothetical protein CRENBAI_025238 [Crenichthys baileyi]|uniref:40S ribosomal protein S27 n=1 Tax=Crenichthys baileyi TaxID=28760 RepID=A0AAV9QS97_9TELE